MKTTNTHKSFKFVVEGVHGKYETFAGGKTEKQATKKVLRDCKGITILSVEVIQ